MPRLSLSPQARTLRWALAAGASGALVGCPQLASDDFSKVPDLATSSDTGGSGSGGSQGSGGTTPQINISTATAAGGDTSASSMTSSGDSQATTTTTSSDTNSQTSNTGDTSSSGGTAGSGGTVGNGGTAGNGGNAGNGGSGAANTTGEPPCEPADEVCDGLDNDCDDVIDPAEVCPDLCAGFSIDGRGYMFCGDTTVVSRARSICGDHGMTLVQIDDAAENAALVKAVQDLWEGRAEANGKQDAFWTSGSDSDDEGEWFWTSSDTAFWSGDETGDPVDDAYENWGSGKPNNAGSDWESEDCAAVYVASGEDGNSSEWNDLPCTDPYTFVCEAE